MIENLVIDKRIRYTNLDEVLTLPHIIRINKFDEDASRSFSQEMTQAHYTGQPIIPVVIETDGGDPYCLMAMIDVIQSSKVPVATIIEGKAFSCGAVLFCVGTEGFRFMGKNATLMIHDILASDGNFKKTEEVMVDAKETKRMTKKIYKIIDKGIGKPQGYTSELVASKTRADWYINPKQAVELGFANHIRIPTLRCEVKVEVTLELPSDNRPNRNRPIRGRRDRRNNTHVDVVPIENNTHIMSLLESRDRSVVSRIDLKSASSSSSDEELLNYFCPGQSVSSSHTLKGERRRGVRIDSDRESQIRTGRTRLLDGSETDLSTGPSRRDDLKSSNNLGRFRVNSEGGFL